MIPAARTSNGTTRAGAGEQGSAEQTVHWYPRRKSAGAPRATALPVKQQLRERPIDEAEPDEAELDEAELDEAEPDEAELDEAELDEAEPDEAELDEAELMAPGGSPSDGRPADPEATDTSPGRAAARSDPNSDGDGFHPTGAVIRQLRLTSGFSVAEFAELLRVSAATVRRWETAHGSLTLRSGSRAALRALRDVITEV